LFALENIGINNSNISSSNFRLRLSNLNQSDLSNKFKALTESLFTDLNSNNSLKLILAKTFVNSASDSNLFIWSSNPKSKSLLAKTSFSGLVQAFPCPSQFNLVPCLNETYYFNEANYSVNKSNFYQHRKISHFVNLNPTGFIEHQIIVKYSYPTPAPQLGSQIYRALIRLYTPKQTSIKSIKLDNQTLDPNTIILKPQQELQEISFPLEYTLNQDHELIINLKSNDSLTKDNKFSYSLRLLKQPDAQNTTQTVAFKYPDNFIPTVLSLPASVKPQTINFNQTPLTSSYYAVSFTPRQD
jgi:hypothetical protein